MSTEIRKASALVAHEIGKHFTTRETRPDLMEVAVDVEADLKELVEDYVQGIKAESLGIGPMD